MRIACLLFSHFPLRLERLRRPELAGRPVVLGGLPEERKSVFDCSEEAEREGVHAGMPLREALSRCPRAVFLEPDHAHYRRVFDDVLDHVETVTPLIEEVGLGCVLAGLAGLERLHPDERALAELLQREAAEASGVLPRVGLASGKFAARVAALRAPDLRGAAPNALEGAIRNATRSGDTFGWRPQVRAVGRLEAAPSHALAIKPPPEGVHVIPPEEMPDFLCALPVEELPVSAGMKRRLRLFGLQTLSDLAALELGALQAQFGPEGRLAWELASGIDEAPFRPRVRSEVVAERLRFPAPSASLESINAALRNLMTRLLRREELQRRSVRQLALKALLSDGHVWERSVTLREATADRERMLLALKNKIENATLPNPVEEICLELSGLCGETGRQEGMFAAKGRRVRQLEDSIRQLKVRYGESPLARVVEVEPWSRIPERRSALIDYDP